MPDTTTRHGAIETPSAPLHDPALMAAAGFLAGYSGTTKIGYTIDLRGYWQWCESHDLHVFDAKRAHVELYVRSLEDTRSEVQQVTVLGEPDTGTFTLAYRRATSPAITHDAPAADVQAALEGIKTIGPGNVTVEAGPAAGIWDVTFTGALGHQAVPNLRPDPDVDRQELGQFLVQAGLSGTRDHALACLLALNGLRVGEACSVDIENIRWERGHRTLVVDRKGGKRAVIPLAPRTSRAVDLAVGERTAGPILLGRHGRLDRYEAYRIVRRLGRKAGIRNNVHPHCLRHGFITAALDAGVPLRDVQEAASHSDPRTTSRYDRHRVSLDRHAAYSVATFVAGATGGR